MKRCFVLGRKGVSAAVFLLLLGLFSAVAAVRAVTVSSSGREIPILMYHSVGYNSRVQSPYLLSPEVFEQDLIWLRNAGYTAVFVSEVVAYAHGQGTLPEKPVVLTLDDGYLNNLTYVLPLLEKYGMKAVVSVVGSFCEEYTNHPSPDPSYAYLTWEDVSSLAASGWVEIGNHTYGMHTTSPRKGCMRRPDESVASYSAALSSDLSRLQAVLADRVGVTPTVFAYPYGAVSSEAVYVLQSLGFRAALTCTERINRIFPGEEEALFRLGRFNRPSGETTHAFMTRVLGI